MNRGGPLSLKIKSFTFPRGFSSPFALNRRTRHDRDEPVLQRCPHHRTGEARPSGPLPHPVRRSAIHSELQSALWSTKTPTGSRFFPLAEPEEHRDQCDPLPACGGLSPVPQAVRHSPPAWRPCRRRRLLKPLARPRGDQGAHLPTAPHADPKGAAGIRPLPSKATLPRTGHAHRLRPFCATVPGKPIWR